MAFFLIRDWLQVQLMLSLAKCLIEHPQFYKTLSVIMKIQCKRAEPKSSPELHMPPQSRMPVFIQRSSLIVSQERLPWKTVMTFYCASSLPHHRSPSAPSADTITKCQRLVPIAPETGVEAEAGKARAPRQPALSSETLMDTEFNLISVFSIFLTPAAVQNTTPQLIASYQFLLVFSKYSFFICKSGQS